jgi:hypothetical protein
VTRLDTVVIDFDGEIMVKRFEHHLALIPEKQTGGLVFGGSTGSIFGP